MLPWVEAQGYVNMRLKPGLPDRAWLALKGFLFRARNNPPFSCEGVFVLATLQSQQALALLHEAETLNPGPWVSHSLHVAEAARYIASHHPGLDSEKAFVLGCLHDIGRRAGVAHMRHVVDGFLFLSRLGCGEPARICLSHSFPLKNVNAVFGRWDCSPEELRMVEDFLDAVQYDDYDRLIQLCDALAMPEGFCLLEKRFIDVALRYGTNELTVPKWKATFEIKGEFERLLGCSVYSLLPGVVENTFDLPKMA